MRPFFTFCFFLAVSPLSLFAQNLVADTVYANKISQKAADLLSRYKYDSALMSFKEAANIYQKYKLTAPWAKMRYDVAFTHYYLNQRDSAIYVLTQTLPHVKSPTLKGKILNSLGVNSLELLRYKDAEQYFKKAITHNTTHFGAASQAVAINNNNLGNLYREMSYYEEALQAYQFALKVYKTTLGEEHPHLGSLYNNIGNLYNDKQNFSKAKEVYTKSLQIYKKSYGEKHPFTLDVYNNLGATEERLMNYPEAERLYEKSILGFKEVIGETHPHVGVLLSNLAQLYSIEKKYPQARETFGQALEIILKGYGEKHTQTATTLAFIGSYFTELHQKDSALYFFQRAIYSTSSEPFSGAYEDTPKPANALHKIHFLEYTRYKALNFYARGELNNALDTYAISAEASRLALQEARRESDKLYIANFSQTPLRRAAYLHFLRAGGRREK